MLRQLALASLLLCTSACPGRPTEDVADAAHDAFMETGIDAPDALDRDTGIAVANDEATEDRVDVPEDTGPPTFDQVQALFTRSCTVGTNTCHRAGNTNGLTLEPDVAYEQIVGVASTELPRLQRIQPGSSGDSFLVLKLRSATLDAIPECTPGVFPPPCGTFMPAAPFSTPLRDSEVALIRRWVDLGAMR